MKNLKNLIIILFFLSLFHICCKSNSSPITLSYYAGKWHNVEDNTLVITIYSDGSMSESSDKKIPASDIARQVMRLNKAMLYILAATLKEHLLLKDTKEIL